MAAWGMRALTRSGRVRTPGTGLVGSRQSYSIMTISLFNSGPDVCRGGRLSRTQFPLSVATSFFHVGRPTDFPQGAGTDHSACWEKEPAPLVQQTCPFYLVFLQRSLVHSPQTTCHFLFNSACLLFYCDSCLSFFCIKLLHFPGEMCHMMILLEQNQIQNMH